MIIRACGENPSQARIQTIVNNANQTTSTIDFQQFIQILDDVRTNDKRLTRNDLLAAFKVFDLDKSGFIHVDELKKVLTQLGEKLTQQEWQNLLSMSNPLSNATIDYTQLAAKLIP